MAPELILKVEWPQSRHRLLIRCGNFRSSHYTIVTIEAFSDRRHREIHSRYFLTPERFFLIFQIFFWKFIAKIVDFKDRLQLLFQQKIKTKTELEDYCRTLPTRNFLGQVLDLIFSKKIQNLLLITIFQIIKNIGFKKL